jgi:hypothetical protein
MYDKLCTIDDSSRADALAAEPTVYCGQCGAKAFDSDSVCDPVELHEGSFPQKGRQK